MQTFDDEKTIFEFFRLISNHEIKFNGRFFHCLRIEKLLKSLLFRKSWIDSSGHNVQPPDFYNNFHHIMMEIMRIDDFNGGKHKYNSFAHEKKAMKCINPNYKKELNGTLFFTPDTSGNVFNFAGYYNNFKRIIEDHSNKVDNYKSNHPKCKKVIFMVCDETNDYVQVKDKIDLTKSKIECFKPHIPYYDKKFIDIIKNCNADYIVWFNRYKSLSVDREMIKQPRAVIYETRQLIDYGIEYDHSLMRKVCEEV